MTRVHKNDRDLHRVSDTTTPMWIGVALLTAYLRASCVRPEQMARDQRHESDKYTTYYDTSALAVRAPLRTTVDVLRKVTSQMKACRVYEFGGPDRLRIEEVPRPEIGPEDVLVRLRAAGLNRADILVREGRFAELSKQQPLPITPGVEGAGDIVEIGSAVSSRRVGQRVALLPMLTCGACAGCTTGDLSTCADLTIIGEHTDGTYAEYIAVPARNAIPIPDTLTYEESAASIVAYMTAWHMLKSRGELTAAETILVVGAGSGMGSAAVQVARALGAEVIATTSTEAKAEQLRAIGAKEVINYRDHPAFSSRVRELTGGTGVDLVHDTVGGATMQESIHSLRHGGRLVAMGSHSGRTAEINLVSIHRNEIDVRGSHTATHRDIEEMMPALADGSLVPVIDSSFSLEEAASAQQRLVHEDRFGKVVLTIG